MIFRVRDDVIEKVEGERVHLANLAVSDDVSSFVVAGLVRELFRDDPGCKAQG